MGALDDYARGLTVSPRSIAAVLPGQAAELSLEPPSVVPDGAFTSTGAQVELRFIAKRVALRAVSPFPPDDFDSAVAGDFPLPLGVSLPAGTAAEGLIGSLRGRIPLSMTMPTLEARWQVFGVERGGDPLTLGVDFLAPAGLSNTSVQLLVKPDIIPARLGGSMDPRTVWVEASVRANLGSASSGWVVLPRVALPVLPVALPELFAAFQDINFTGYALVQVPASLGLDLAALRATLAQLSTVAAALNGFANFALLATGLDALAGGLAQAPAIAFRDHDFINDWDDVQMYYRAVVWNRYWDSEASSFVCLLAPRTRFKFWEDQSRSNASVLIDPSGAASPGNVVSVVRNMHYKRPASEPDGTLAFDGTPGTFQHHWGDEIECSEFLFV